MSGVTTIADAIGTLDGVKQEIEAHIALMGDIKAWTEEQIGALATSGLSEGELGNAVALLKARVEGLEGGLSQINHAVQGALQVCDLVSQY